VLLASTGSLDAIGRSLREGFFMFWETLWPLVLGFGLSGAVQAFVSREAMQRKLGDHKAPAVARASFYGMVSSSCSYAASAMSKSLFVKGADFVSANVFMFASTNLVIELGIVLVVLMGWQFAASEFIGGVIMIVRLDPARPAGLFLTLPERRAGLEVIHQEFGRFKRRLPVLRGRQHQHDIFAGRDAADTMNHGQAHQRPARHRGLGMPGDFSLRHAGIMFERQRGDGSVVLAVAANAGKTDDGTDILAPVRQRRDLMCDVEIGLLNPDGHGCGHDRRDGCQMD